MKIPYISTPDIALTSTTQDHLPIADITDDLVLYKDGGAAIVMESTSLNFGLLSEKEQEAVIAAYAALLNSLSFSIQIVIRTQRKDISSYMHYLDQSQSQIRNPKLLGLMQGYKRFILDSVKKKNVLGKRFYIVIPFSPLELGIKKSILSSTRRKKSLPFPKSYIVGKAKVVLTPRRDHLIRQAGRLGIKLRALTKNDLLELYYNIFNPQMPGVKKEGS